MKSKGYFNLGQYFSEYGLICKIVVLCAFLIFCASKNKAEGTLTWTRISIPTTLNGNLSSSDYQLDDGSYIDIYELTLTADTQVEISLTSSAFDAFLYVIDVFDWDPFYWDDDGGDGTDSYLSELLPASTYWILVNSYGANETGSYTLSVTPEGPPPDQVETIIDNSMVSVYAVNHALNDNTPTLQRVFAHQAISTAINGVLSLVTHGLITWWSPSSWISFVMNITDTMFDPIKVIPVGDITDDNAMYASQPAVKLNDTGSIGAMVYLDYKGVNKTDMDVSGWESLYLRLWSSYNFGTTFDYKILLTAEQMRRLAPTKSYIIVPKWTLNTSSIIGSRKPYIEAIARWKSNLNLSIPYESRVILLFNE